MPGQKECTKDEALREVEQRDLIISTKGRSQFALDVGNDQDGNEFTNDGEEVYIFLPSCPPFCFH